MEVIVLFLLVGIILGLASFAVLLVCVYYTSKVPNKKRLQLNFVDPKTDKEYPFPDIHEAAEVELSVVIPAYNESKRLPPCLAEMIPYLESQSYSYEIIIVDDGSKDSTVDLALTYTMKYGTDKFRVMKLPENRGKGGAIRQGVLSARGDEILFADADGATDIRDLGKVKAALSSLKENRNSACISIGSRAHLQDDAVANRSFFRNILMWGFHMFVSVVGGIDNIKDTQCGFKLFTRTAAVQIFSQLNIERWAFDVEIFVIAKYLGIPTVEVAVNWEEIDGSKLVPIYSWMEMAKDLLMIRLRYLIGAWTVETQKTK